MLRQQLEFERDDMDKRRSMFLTRRLYEESMYKNMSTKHNDVHLDLSKLIENDSLKQRKLKR